MLSPTVTLKHYELNKETKKNANDIIYLSLLQQLVKKNQPKCKNNLTYYINVNTCSYYEVV